MCPLSKLSLSFKIKNELYISTSLELQYCWERGGYLAEMESSYEESSLDPNIPNEVLWIGLTDAADEGVNTANINICIL